MHLIYKVLSNRSNLYFLSPVQTGKFSLSSLRRPCTCFQSSFFNKFCQPTLFKYVNNLMIIFVQISCSHATKLKTAETVYTFHTLKVNFKTTLNGNGRSKMSAQSRTAQLLDKFSLTAVHMNIFSCSEAGVTTF